MKSQTTERHIFRFITFGRNLLNTLPSSNRIVQFLNCFGISDRLKENEIISFRYNTHDLLTDTSIVIVG